VGDLARLGSRWDSEPDGQPTAGADGDDNNYFGVGGPDDEDGVVFGPNYVDVTISLLAGTADLLLRAWWDVNWNGFFEHPGELFIDDLIMSMGMGGTVTKRYMLGFDPRLYYSRFRLTWATEGHGAGLGDVTPWGEFFDQVSGVSAGEVEDYAPIPEPGSIALALLGWVVFGLWYRKARYPWHSAEGAVAV